MLNEKILELLKTFGIKLERDFLIEGKAKIKININDLNKISSKSEVFYNPVMRVNRDFTIIFLEYLYKRLDRKLSILDSMAASGVRSIRILKEVSDVVGHLHINDISNSSINYIKNNLHINGLSSTDNIEITQKDIRLIISESSRKYDYIDIDPFGSPVSFVENISRIVRNKGSIGVTATDISALSGSRKRALFRKYGIFGEKTDFYLEFGLRALIKYVINEGLKNNVAFIPVFGYYYQHHYRVFFIKSVKRKDINFLIDNINLFTYCKNCHYKSTEINTTCEVCGNRTIILGPIFTGKVYEESFLDFVKNNIDKFEISAITKKVFNTIYNNDFRTYVWYYYDIPSLGKAWKIPELPKINYILEKYNCYRTHFTPTGIKCEKYPIFIKK